jgi:hypothetical protein
MACLREGEGGDQDEAGVRARASEEREHAFTGLIDGPALVSTYLPAFHVLEGAFLDFKLTTVSLQVD